MLHHCFWWDKIPCGSRVDHNSDGLFSNPGHAEQLLRAFRNAHLPCKLSDKDIWPIEHPVIAVIRPSKKFIQLSFSDEFCLVRSSRFLFEMKICLGSVSPLSLTSIVAYQCPNFIWIRLLCWGLVNYFEKDFHMFLVTVALNPAYSEFVLVYHSILFVSTWTSPGNVSDFLGWLSFSGPFSGTMRKKCPLVALPSRFV